MNAPAPSLFYTSFARNAAAFGDIHCGTDSRILVRNLMTHVELMQAGECIMPGTVNHGEAGNAWVCSPLTTYCGYAREELERNVHPIIGKPLGLLCRAYGHVLERAAIDRAVTLNNWLLSTNIYPPLDGRALKNLVQDVRCRWPQHALWFRSLNENLNQDWIGALAALGFQMIPSRQVYLFDELQSKISRHRDLKRDMQLLRNTPLKCTDGSDFTEVDYRRIEALYGKLYLEKYSMLNPHYTACFIERWHRSGLFQFRGFRDCGGTLQAVVGMFAQGDIITAPIVGYETALPQSLGLYRLLMASVFEEAIATGATVNLSAGAANFKRLRGGTPAIEYSAVLASHLPASTRRAVAVLSTLTTKIGIPIMKRFKL